MVLLKLALCVLLYGFASANPPANRPRGNADSVRMFATFPHAVAVFTTQNDTSFKCLSATRRNFKPREKTVTYVWHFKNHTGHQRRDVVFDVDFSETPGEGTFFVNNDKTRPFRAIYKYSDYTTCAVISFPYGEKDHCTMWMKRARVHNVPQHCLDKYEEICDIGVHLVDRDICRDDDD
uniref:Lipocalin n=1 Tax=Rhipicephalus appendiculatus TaxID=34631 RepID=A0A131Z3C8_RHIAP